MNSEPSAIGSAPTKVVLQLLLAIPLPKGCFLYCRWRGSGEKNKTQMLPCENTNLLFKVNTPIPVYRSCVTLSEMQKAGVHLSLFYVIAPFYFDLLFPCQSHAFISCWTLADVIFDAWWQPWCWQFISVLIIWKQKEPTALLIWSWSMAFFSWLYTLCQEDSLEIFELLAANLTFW